MIFSVTEVGDFMRCRRRWWETSFNGNAYTPALPDKALRDGSIWHGGNELTVTNDGAMRVDSLDQAMVNAFEVVKESINANLLAVRGHGLAVDEELDLEEEKDLLTSMAINYEAYWSSKGEYPLPPEFEMIQAEQTCVVPVPGTAHSLEATLDGLMRHRDTGLIHVLERKTFDKHPQEIALDVEFQFTAYMWVVQQLGFEPGGVAYDGAWKRLAPPRGRTMDDLFLRVPLTRSHAWLADFEASLAQQVNDMAEAAIIPAKRYPNRVTFVSGCTWCRMKEVCDAMSDGKPELADTLRAQFARRDPGHRIAIWSKES